MHSLLVFFFEGYGDHRDLHVYTLFPYTTLFRAPGDRRPGARPNAGADIRSDGGRHAAAPPRPVRPDRGTPSAALRHRRAAPQGQERGLLAASGEVGAVALDVAGEVEGVLVPQEIGRASCRERGWQSV